MNLNLIAFICLSLLMFSSCSNDDDGNNGDANSLKPCSFVQNDEDMDGVLDDNERSLWNQCIEEKIEGRAEIRAALIGEWELIGHAEGWIPTLSQPCGKLSITNEEVSLEFHSFHTDTTVTFPFELNEDEDWFLIDAPELIEWLLPFSSVSDQLLVGPENVDDATIFIYEKVE